MHQIARDFRLPVDHHLLAGEIGNVDPHQPLAIGQVEPVMQDAFGAHSFIDAQPVEQIRRGTLQHAGANAAQHVIACGPLHDGHRDPFRTQQVVEAATAEVN